MAKSNNPTCSGFRNADCSDSDCCETDYANAICSTWSNMQCSSPEDGTYMYMVSATNSAVGDEQESSSGVMEGISQTKYDTDCCAVAATCEGYTCQNGGTLVGAAVTRSCFAASCTDELCCTMPTPAPTPPTPMCGNSMSMENCPAGKFWDQAKVSMVLTNADDAAAVNEQCCTACADATCSSSYNPIESRDCTAANTMMTDASNMPYMEDESNMCVEPSAETWEGICCMEKANCAGYTCVYGSLRNNPASTHCTGDASTCDDATCCSGDDMMCADYTAASDPVADEASRWTFPLAGLLAAAAGLQMN